MDDLVSRLARELPDTDKNRYDIAFRRGRAQARSSLLFGGLAIGAAIGSFATLLLDPAEGRSRRAALGQRLSALRNDIRQTVEVRATDLRNRTVGAATELGLPGTPPSNEEARPAPSLAPRSAGAHTGVSNAVPDESLDPVGAASGER